MLQLLTDVFQYYEDKDADNPSDDWSQYRTSNILELDYIGLNKENKISQKQENKNKEISS